MLRFKTRFLCAALLAIAGSNANAASCGIGTIQTVMVGAWNWQGIHIIIDYEAGNEAPASSLFNNNKVRFLKSSFSDDDFKTIKAAVLLAYANGSRVQANTSTTKGSGEPDCGNAVELFLLP